MSDFHTFRLVTGRKPHRCEQCRSQIDAGERHRKSALVWEGEFHAYREHLDCYAAWRALNFDVRDIHPTEGAPFLSDDEHEPEDLDWMREEYPVVADRLGWVSGHADSSK